MGDIRWESKLLETMEARSSDAVELATRLAETSRETPAELAKVTAHYLEQCGLFPFAHTAGAGGVNVLARYDGGSPPISPPGRHLVLCGYARAAFPGDAVRLAAVLWVTELVVRLRMPISGPLTLLLVGGEDPEFGVPWVLDRDLIEAPTAAVIAGSSGRAHPAIAQLGCCQFEVHLASRSDVDAAVPLPSSGDPVIVRAAEAVLALRGIGEMKADVPPELVDLVKASRHAMGDGDGRSGVAFDHVSVNIGTIDGGSAIGTAPRRCVIGVDCGLPFGIDGGPVLAQAQRLLAEASLPAEVIERGSGAPASLTAASEPVVRSLLGAVRDVVDPRAHGVLHPSSGDARWFRERGIPALQYGSSGQAKDSEAADLLEVAKVYALTVLRYLRTE